MEGEKIMGEETAEKDPRDGGTDAACGRIREETGPVSEEEIRCFLHTKSIGKRLVVLSEISSTNDVAKQLAEQGAEEGTAVVADRQSAGKGRRGRSFFSPGSKGIYVSLVLRPKLAPEQAVLLTTMAAVAVARAIEQASGVPAQIKWVNDVFLNGKKVCGILAEASIDAASERLAYAVLGIGINVEPMEFPEELRQTATSIGNEGGKVPSRSALLAQLFAELELLYETLGSGDFLDEYRRRSFLLGTQIRVCSEQGSYPARAVDVDERGRLVVETADGARRALDSGEVSVRGLP